MSAAICAADVERFRAIVVRHLGLRLDSPDGHVLDVLRQRVSASGGSCAAYLDRLATLCPPDEIAAVAEEVTVGETYFFRNVEQFQALAEVALPERVRARAAERRLSLLSAGCASGEEPYTMAMVVRDVGFDPSWEVSILGVDVNRAALRRAEAGRYSPWALRAIPAEAKRRWFRVDGQSAVLDEGIRGAVRFVAGNLVEERPELWQPDRYDVIFCRNVLIYLTPHAAQALVARLVRALAPGGFLFLGHAEAMRSPSLELMRTHGTFYHRRCPADPPPAAGDWVAGIGRASGRVRALTTAAPAPPRPPGPPDWDRALGLLRDERFAAALALVEAFPAAVRNRPDAAILHAVLLAQDGQLDRAEELCRWLLECDGLNAGAHYLLAACLESAGDWPGAGSHHQAAADLDRSFALPRLRLGLLARQRGDGGAARRELGRALTMLTREDPRRLLLFGGGFTREALIALCRAELVAAGGTP